MFHSGTLQSGISLAISQQKLVAIFVGQEDDTLSTLWEENWLQSSHGDRSIGEAIAEKAVFLRVEHGSQEADFLSAFCPIEKVPMLAIVHNGRVMQRVEVGIEEDEWREKVLGALGGEDSEVGVAPPTAQEPILEEVSPGAQAEPTVQSSQAQSLLSERGQHLEAGRVAQAAREKAARVARAKAAREQAEAAAAAEQAAQPKIDKGKGRAIDPADVRQKARLDWVQQQAKRKGEAQTEKARILAQIQADKLERQTRSQNKHQPAPSSALPQSSPTQPTSATCALQIRLFDGSSLRGRFASSATLGTAVRMWVSQNSPPGGASTPYNFRLMQAPAPSRTIGPSEEEESLQDIGLSPSATLVLVPVSGSVDAYGGSATSVFSHGILASTLGLVNTAVGAVTSTLSYVTGFGASAAASSSTAAESSLYMGGTGDEQEASNVQGARMAGADSGAGAGMRMKTLADQRAERDRDAKGKTEFYNGNSSAFEGRKDGDEGT
nr:hypothetical protein B0A51_08330 [Rachicladosporium sp. CCFEE 5018]